MAFRSKKLKRLEGTIDKAKFYQLEDALLLVKRNAVAKFNESVDVAIRLGVDPRKSDQVVRGALVLPEGTGKTVRIAVFATGEKAQAAKDAGADRVGFEDLADEIKSGQCDYDVIIATPDAMKIVGTLGQILGPKGLMPNPKLGTVSADVVQAVKNARAGQVQYRTDKAGIVHCSIGKSSFSEGALKNNLLALLDALSKAKPSASKGIFFRKLCITSTMGVGSVRVDLSILSFK